jgi:Domain of unknown function (DUF1707)/Cell wall-active antibiotics response 4TMS YvqF
MPLDEPNASLPALRIDVDDRERAVARLSEAYASDMLPMHEFERRVEAAYRAETESDLAMLLRDLPQRETARAITTVPDAARRVITATFSSVAQNRFEIVPPLLEIRARFGNVVLDFTRTAFLPGVTEIRILAQFGNVEIALPDGVRIENEGSAFLGTFEYTDERPPGALPEHRSAQNRAVVRITGRALFGNIEISQYLVPVALAPSDALSAGEG